MAVIYIRCEEFDKAMDLIEEVLVEESLPTVNAFKHDKTYDPIRDNPRFIALMEKFKL